MILYKSKSVGPSPIKLKKSKAFFPDTVYRQTESIGFLDIVLGLLYFFMKQMPLFLSVQYLLSNTQNVGRFAKLYGIDRKTMVKWIVNYTDVDEREYRYVRSLSMEVRLKLIRQLGLYRAFKKRDIKALGGYSSFTFTHRINVIDIGIIVAEGALRWNDIFPARLTMLILKCLIEQEKEGQHRFEGLNTQLVILEEHFKNEEGFLSWLGWKG